MEDLAHRFLGCGYDVCGEYANAVSVKQRIFDLSQVPKKYIRQLDNRSTDFFSVTGQTVEEYQRSLSARVEISGSYEQLFSGSITSSFESSELAIKESGFFSIQLCMRYETWKLQTSATEYVYPDVLKDFETRDGEWLIENYGGCVVMGIDIGGRWADNLVVSKFYENSTRNVELKMGAAYGSVVSAQGGVDVSKTVEKEQSIVKRRVKVIGGDPAHAPRNLEQWQASVELKPALMDFTRNDGLVPIWEVFSAFKDKLKKGFDAYIKKRALNIEKKRIVMAKYTEGSKFATSAGSGARQTLDLYKPSDFTTWKYVGHSGNNNKVLVLKEISDQYGALCKPVDWLPVWNDRRSKNVWKNYSCWLPLGPPGFVALGAFCRFKVSNQGKPTEEEAEGIVMVHKSLVEECDFAENKSNIWRDHGTFAKCDLTLGQLPHNALWPSHTTDPNAGILPTKYTLKSEYIHCDT